jgi:hypothetical protein
MIVFKKFKKIQKFVSSKHTIRDEPMKENKSLLEKINRFPKENEKHKKEDSEKFKELQSEKENLIQKVNWKENWALLTSIIVAIVAVVGLIFTYEEHKRQEEEHKRQEEEHKRQEENKRQEEEHKKKYPKSNVEKVQAYFKERKISLDTKNQIENAEIEDLMKNVVDLARRENSIYLVYGENRIGKSTTMKKTLLRNPDLDFLYIEKGIGELVKNLVFDYDSKTSHFTLEEVIDNALTDYGDYRRQIKEKQSENFKENAIIVFDNTNKIKDEIFLQNFKDIIKITLVDNKRPIVFIFLSSEGKGPSTLMVNMSRMKVYRVKEPLK